MDPTRLVEVPYVTFNPPDKLANKKVLMAQFSYSLSDQEAEAMLNYRQDDETVGVLKGNTDVRLKNTVWGRVRFSETTEIVERWIDDAQYLDDTIQFRVNTGFGVQNVLLSRVQRNLLPNDQRRPRKKHNEYRVVRPRRNAPARRLPFLDPFPINQECRRYLDDTYWGLNPDILDPMEVSDSLMVWKSWLHALLCGLQNHSGLEEDRGYIIHIKWIRVDPHEDSEVPYITFIPPQSKKLRGKNVLKAEGSYELTDTEVAMVTANQVGKYKFDSYRYTWYGP